MGGWKKIHFLYLSIEQLSETGKKMASANTTAQRRHICSLHLSHLQRGDHDQQRLARCIFVWL